MKIKRYEIQRCPVTKRYRVVDKKEDCFVSMTMSAATKKEIKDLMGKNMAEVVDSTRIHPGYLKHLTINNAPS